MIGSRARGDHSEQSDLDLIALSGEPGFERFVEQGLIVELHVVRDPSDWSKQPSWWYALGEMDIKVDDGTLSGLPALVERWRSAYSPPLDEVRRNRDWLEATIRKLQKAESELETAFLVTTSTWEILAGAFIAQAMPVPASSHMFRLAGRVIGEERFAALLEGELPKRRRVALELCRQIVRAHASRLSTRATNAQGDHLPDAVPAFGAEAGPASDAGLTSGSSGRTRPGGTGEALSRRR